MRQPLVSPRVLVRYRYGAPIVLAGRPTRPPAVEDTIIAHVSPAPAAPREVDRDGAAPLARIALATYDDVRGVSQTAQEYPDRVVVDGRVYEIDAVTITPAVSGWESPRICEAVEIDPLTYPDGGAGAAPQIIVPPAISGTFAAGETLTAIPPIVVGAGPIVISYEWIVDGDVVGQGANFALPDPIPEGYSIFVEATTTSEYGTDDARSQSLGGAGGGPVDCEVDCAATIAAAVAAAEEPLQDEIDALQVVVDAIPATVAAAEVAAAAAALAGVPATWREYTQRTPHAQAGSWSVVGGLLQCVHAGDAQTEPNAVSPRTTWRIVDPKGDNAADGMLWGPVQITFGTVPNGGSILVYAHSDPTPGADGLGMLLTRTGAATANWTRTRMALVGGVWVLNTTSTGRATAAATVTSAPAATSLVRVTVQVYELAGVPSTASATELTGGYAIAADAWVQQIRYLTVQAIGAAGTWQARIHAAPGAVLPLGVP